MKSLDQIGGNKTMGKKYCPVCKEVVDTRALMNYSQESYNNVIAKIRNVTHRVEDGGCGHVWKTAEIPLDDRE